MLSVIKPYIMKGLKVSGTNTIHNRHNKSFIYILHKVMKLQVFTTTNRQQLYCFLYTYIKNKLLQYD